MLMAGGRVRRGYVHGATDADGAKVASAAVTVPDLFATLAKALEIDPKAELMSPIGRPIAISDSGKAVDALLS